MCGIVGLLLKKPALRDQLGELMAPMLIGMTSRGPDSAGVAIFGDGVTDSHKLSLFWGEGAADWKRLTDRKFQPGKQHDFGEHLGPQRGARDDRHGREVARRATASRKVYRKDAQFRFLPA